jgi:hypothetical protein
MFRKSNTFYLTYKINQKSSSKLTQFENKKAEMILKLHQLNYQKSKLIKLQRKKYYKSKQIKISLSNHKLDLSQQIL